MLKLCSENDVPVFFEPTDPRKGSKALKSPWTKGGLISKKKLTGRFLEKNVLAKQGNGV